MTNVHPATSVEDALVMLDTRVPLLQSERRMIVDGLWRTAFKAGAQQGRLAGMEAEKKRLRDIADKLVVGIAQAHDPRGLRKLVNFLRRVADLEALEETVAILNDPDTLDAIEEGSREYPDPGKARREHLTRLACERAIRRNEGLGLKRSEEGTA